MPETYNCLRVRLRCVVSTRKWTDTNSYSNPSYCSLVEGSGFRHFMSVVGPQYQKLSQRGVGLRLYDEVEIGRAHV